MPFLPDDYKPPVDSNYMRFEDGENTFRVLSDAITGTEYWKTITNEQGEEVRRPIRLKPDQEVKIEDLEEDEDGELVMPKHFWVFVVYNREAKKIQILEITQKRIRNKITTLLNNKKWGDPKDYDITVTRSGTGKYGTTYETMPNPKEKIEKAILEKYKAMDINLEALYSGDDPFASMKNKEEVKPEEVNV